MKLYYYEHCPYCVRVLTVLGMASLDFEPVVLLNDDADTPTRLIGQKMVPILQKESGELMAESLDIADYVSETYHFPLTENADWASQVNDLLAEIRIANYSLTMPRWVKAPLKEFATQAAIDYFIKKKTQTIGDFDTALANTAQFIAALTEKLNVRRELFVTLTAHPRSKPAIILFSALYGLRFVEGFAWTPESTAFMQAMADESGLILDI